MLSLALVVLKDKIQFLVLALAVKVSPWSWPWTSSPWQLVESFYHNRLVVQWYGPWFTSLGNTDYLQHINSPTCNQPESPLPLLCQKFASIQPFLATFCVRRLRLHLWNMCSLRVDCSCVQIKHACPLSNSLLETLVFLKCNSSVCVWCCSMQHMTSLCSRIERWRTVMNYSTDKICIQNLLLYTEHVIWFQLFVIDLIFWHITFTTDLCGASKM